jgi:hypothetical protein
MADETTGITGSNQAETLDNADEATLRQWLASEHTRLALRIDHVDQGVHELAQQCDRIEKHLEAIAADVAAARPLLERFQHSAIARLAKGQMPWSAS